MSGGETKRAWLGLGGNIGDVKQALLQALRAFESQTNITLANVAPLYKTPPWGVEDQPWFLNCCAEITTSLSPEALLEVCQEAEKEGKRERIQRWGPRTIDIDIIAFEGIEQIEQRLTIPHPRATERAFVMVPLAHIAPELMLQGQTVRQWADSLEADDMELDTATENWWV